MGMSAALVTTEKRFSTRWTRLNGVTAAGPSVPERMSGGAVKSTIVAICCRKKKMPSDESSRRYGRWNSSQRRRSQPSRCRRKPRKMRLISAEPENVMMKNAVMLTLSHAPATTASSVQTWVKVAQALCIQPSCAPYARRWPRPSGALKHQTSVTTRIAGVAAASERGIGDVQQLGGVRQQAEGEQEREEKRGDAGQGNQRR